LGLLQAKDSFLKIAQPASSNTLFFETKEATKIQLLVEQT
jgi:hypothetical protein